MNAIGEAMVSVGNPSVGVRHPAINASLVDCQVACDSCDSFRKTVVIPASQQNARVYAGLWTRHELSKRKARPESGNVA